MTRKKGKSVSFDAMVKFFLKSYNIPTTKDFEKLMTRMDRLEELLQSLQISNARSKTVMRTSSRGKTAADGPVAATASDTVLDIIQKSRKGVGFADIKAQTGFEEKKLRNIIFRLDKLGRIKRISRGIYTSA